MLRTLAFLPLFIGFASSLALADTILFPGTFDPFHKTHLEEVLRARLGHPNASVLILPIEDAYYNRTTKNPRPFLFTFEDRAALIGAETAHRPGIAVSTALRKIDRPIFDVLLEVARNTGDPNIFLLVGTDVIERWSKMPGFEDLLTHVTLLVDGDPVVEDLYQKLRGKFGHHPKIKFIGMDREGVRSADVNAAIFGSHDDLAKLLPEGGAEWIHANESRLQARYRAYFDALFDYTVDKVEKNVLPILRGQTTDKRWFALKAALEKAHAPMTAAEREAHVFTTFAILNRVVELPAFTEGDPEGTAKFAFRLFRELRSTAERRAAEDLTKLPKFEWREIDGVRRLFVEKNGAMQELKLRKYPAGTPFFHWNDAETSPKWWKQGKVLASDLYWRTANLNRSLGTQNLKVGGGLYFSEDALDSARYGGIETVAEATTELLFVEQAGPILWSDEVDHVYLAVLRAAGVHGIQMTPFDHNGRQVKWLSFVHPDSVGKVRPGTLDDLRNHGVYRPDAIDDYPIAYWLELERSRGTAALFSEIPADSLAAKVIAGLPLGAEETALLEEKLALYFQSPLLKETPAGDSWVAAQLRGFLVTHPVGVPAPPDWRTVGADAYREATPEIRRTRWPTNRAYCEKIMGRAS